MQSTVVWRERKPLVMDTVGKKSGHLRLPGPVILEVCLFRYIKNSLASQSVSQLVSQLVSRSFSQSVSQSVR